METVSALLDDGAPVSILVIRGRLLLLTDPRIVPGTTAASMAGLIGRWMADTNTTPDRAADVLASRVRQIAAGALTLPQASDHAAA
ncbi:hypothetical protein ACFXAF_25875 [Kitasatospora sp. NPDC059463]|uniref:hypothetical protein n=1 Tax=unclassified Kitasatospora TaxID=2633591 RepID=UPI0036A4D6A9